MAEEAVLLLVVATMRFQDCRLRIGFLKLGTKVYQQRTRARRTKRISMYPACSALLHLSIKKKKKAYHKNLLFLIIKAYVVQLGDLLTTR